MSEKILNNPGPEEVLNNPGPYCCVINCNNNRQRNSNLHFYSFPKQEERCKIWINNSKNLYLLDRMERKQFKCYSYRLCSEHFEVSQFSDPQRTRLNKNAVPTLFNIPHASKRIKSTKLKLKRKPISNAKKKSVIKTVEVESTGKFSIKNPLLNAETAVSNSNEFVLITSNTNEKISVGKSADVDSTETLVINNPISNYNEISSLSEFTDVNSTEKLLTKCLVSNVKKKSVSKSTHVDLTGKLLSKAISKAKTKTMPISTELDSTGRLLIKYTLSNRTSKFSIPKATNVSSSLIKKPISNKKKKSKATKSTDIKGTYTAKNNAQIEKKKLNEEVTGTNPQRCKRTKEDVVENNSQIHNKNEVMENNSQIPKKTLDEEIDETIEQVLRKMLNQCVADNNPQIRNITLNEEVVENNAQIHKKTNAEFVENNTQIHKKTNEEVVENNSQIRKNTLSEEVAENNSQIYKKTLSEEVEETNEQLHKKMLNEKTNLINMKKSLKAKHEQLRRLRKRYEVLLRKEEYQVVEKKKKRKSSEKEKGFAIGLYDISSSAYNYCKNQFDLPSVRTINRWKRGDKVSDEETVKNINAHDSLQDFICDTTITYSDNS